VAAAVRAVILVEELEQLAWDVLSTVNQTQAKGSTARIVVPRDPEISYGLEEVPTEGELLTAGGVSPRPGLRGARRYRPHKGLLHHHTRGARLARQRPARASNQVTKKTCKQDTKILYSQ
jgi:hypothetical protein